VQSDIVRFFKVPGVSISPNDLAGMPFGRQIEFIHKLRAFESHPDTKKGWVSLKGRKSPGPAIREFVKLYQATSFYVAVRWEEYYRPDSVEIYYQTGKAAE